MRVALVVEGFRPAGGVEQVVWQVARGLRDAGDEVHVVAREGTPMPGVVLHRVAAPAVWQPLRVASFALGAARAVGPRGGPAPAARGRRFDVVHAFCRAWRQDVFHAGGGSHADYMLHTYGARRAAWRRAAPRHALQLALERRLFADPRVTVQCVSHMVAGEIAGRHGVSPGRLPVVYNGVDVGRFAPERLTASRARLRRELGAPAGDASVWLLAGSGWRRKGLDVALRALALCDDRGAQLWVAGADAPAPWVRLAERLGVGGRVRFLGPRDDLEAVLAAADGLLHPSRYDAFGLVCLEAAAAQRPVVLSARTGAAELLAGAGRVVEDPEDARAFARSLDALSDRALREALGERARRVAAEHDWRRHVEELRALYARRAAA